MINLINELPWTSLAWPFHTLNKVLVSWLGLFHISDNGQYSKIFFQKKKANEPMTSKIEVEVGTTRPIPNQNLTDFQVIWCQVMVWWNHVHVEFFLTHLRNKLGLTWLFCVKSNLDKMNEPKLTLSLLY